MTKKRQNRKGRKNATHQKSKKQFGSCDYVRLSGLDKCKNGEFSLKGRDRRNMVVSWECMYCRDIFLGFIWYTEDLFTVYNCPERAEIISSWIVAPKPAGEANCATTCRESVLHHTLPGRDAKPQPDGGGGRKDDFKDSIFALAEQLYNVETSFWSQMNPTKFLYNTCTLSSTPMSSWSL